VPNQRQKHRPIPTGYRQLAEIPTVYVNGGLQKEADLGNGVYPYKIMAGIDKKKSEKDAAEKVEVIWGMTKKGQTFCSWRTMGEAVL